MHWGYWSQIFPLLFAFVNNNLLSFRLATNRAYIDAMMSSLKKVLLIGVRPHLPAEIVLNLICWLWTKASGNLGTHVLDIFLGSPYKVSVLTRKESTSTFPQGVPVFRADYSDQNQLEFARKGHQVVICMVAMCATGGQQILVDAAIAAGVEMFLPSEFGPPSWNERFAALHPALPLKVATVDYLRSKESQIPWSALIPGAFFDWGMKLGLFGFDFRSKTATLVGGGTAYFTASTLPTIARGILEMLQYLHATKNKYV